MQKNWLTRLLTSQNCWGKIYILLLISNCVISGNLYLCLSVVILLRFSFSIIQKKKSWLNSKVCKKGKKRFSLVVTVLSKFSQQDSYEVKPRKNDETTPLHLGYVWHVLGEIYPAHNSTRHTSTTPVMTVKLASPDMNPLPFRAWSAPPSECGYLPRTNANDHWRSARTGGTEANPITRWIND